MTNLLQKTSCQILRFYKADIIPELAYTLNEDGQSYSVTGIGTWTDPVLVIPDTYHGLKATTIAYRAFYECSALTSIILPDICPRRQRSLASKMVSTQSYTYPNTRKKLQKQKPRLMPRFFGMLHRFRYGFFNIRTFSTGSHSMMEMSAFVSTSSAEIISTSRFIALYAFVSLMP